MRVVLILFSVIAVLLALAAFAIAKSAIHEIYGAVFFVVAAVLFSGAAVVDAIINGFEKTRKDRAEAFKTLSDWLEVRLPR